MSAGSVLAGPGPHEERDRFLAGGVPSPGVRREVLASWRRSSLSGADPCLTGLPYRGEADLGGRLYSAASPILGRLADRLADTGTAVLLADRTARIIARWVADPHLRRIMDAHQSAPGFSLEEDICGTNGLGSVLEERRPLHVVGHEHFAQWFVGFACFGAPIWHPVTGRLEGVLTLVCRSDQASPLMLPFVEETSDRIREGMLALAGSRDAALVHAFSDAARRTRHGVVALSKETFITNAAAARVVDAIDHAVLWESAAAGIARGAAAHHSFALPDGRVLSAVLEPVAMGDRIVGVVMELEAPTTPAPEAPSGAAGAGVAGRSLLERVGGLSPQLLAVLRSAAAAVGQAYPLVVSGESGTGKLHLARAIHEQAADATRLEVVDAALARMEGMASWGGRLRAVLRQPGTVVLRHLEVLAPDEAHIVAAIVDETAGSGARPVGLVTCEPGAAPTRGPHVERLAVARIHLPPLRERTEDIPVLIDRMLTRWTAGRLSVGPDVQQALLRCQWPGNVRQLEQFVRLVSSTRPAGRITLDDVPEELLHAGPPAPSMLEDLERQAIIRALRAANGNKKEAASRLGISRSTLYRKLSAHGLDLDRRMV